MRALDLFCGAGGAARGLQRAGFHVTGVDHKAQPRYAGDCFVRADALNPPFDLADFDFVWASPPCQAFTSTLNNRHKLAARHPNLIPQTRTLLSGHPSTCIENVPGAPLRPDLLLTGAMFDLDVVRDRVFELSFRAPFALARQHRGSVCNGDLACVVGHGTNLPQSVRAKYGAKNWKELPEAFRKKLSARNSARGWMEALGIDWMTRAELSQAIPPAYAEWIGRAAMNIGED